MSGVSSETLRLLLAAGLAGDDLLAVVESIERTDAKPVSAGAARMRRYRERQAQSVTCDVTVTRNGDDFGDKDVSPEPPSEKTPSLPKGPLKGPQKVSAPTSEKPSKPISAWVSEIWDATPTEGHKRSSRREIETSLKAAIRRGHDPGRILAGLIAYYATDDATKQDRKFARGVHVMIENDRWEAFEATEPTPPDDDPWRRRLLGWRVNQYWNSEWGPKPGREGYLGPAETEARAA